MNARREEVEQGFIEFLEQLKPKHEYLRLFGEIILDVWKEKQTQAAAVHDALLRRLADLKKRKQLLVEAFVYKRALDQHTYQDEFDRLNEEITLAEMEAEDARLDQLDIEAAVEFAQYVLLNAARLWSESGPDQKQRLQKLIFPAGVLFAEGAYRTSTTSMIFFELEDIHDHKGKVGSATGKRYDRWSKSQVKRGKTRAHQGFQNSMPKPFYQSRGDFLALDFAQK